MALKAAVEGRAQPTGSAPDEVADTAADAADKLGAMAGEDDPQPDEAAEDADAGTDAESKDEAEGEEPAEESKDDAESEGDDEKGTEDAADEAEGHRSPRAERRIAALTAEKKQIESRATAAETRAKDLETIAAQNVGLHPDYVQEAEARLIARAQTLRTRERELLKTWDGVESDDPAKNKTPEQVRSEWADVRSELDEVGPKARRLYDERLSQMVADMQEGRRMRLERARATPRGSPPAAAKTVRPPPAIPKGTAGAAGVKTPRGANAPSEERFLKSGGSRHAAERELSMMAGAE